MWLQLFRRLGRRRVVESEKTGDDSRMGLCAMPKASAVWVAD
jgi:hypothetical protein